MNRLTKMMKNTECLTVTKIMKRISLLIITAMVFGGCALYKPYERPKVETDGLYRDSIAATDTISIASLTWRQLFTDPELQQLIERGLNNNTDLRVARLRVTEAAASLKSAKLAYLPSLAFNPQGNVSSVIEQKALQTYQVGVSASWELDIFGKITNAKRGAEAALEQSDAYRQAVQVQLVATIADSYYTLLMLDSQKEITDRTIVNWRESVKVMRALKEAGQVSEAAVSQSEASLLAVEASQLTLIRQINEMENGISVLLGDMPSGISRGTMNGQSFPEELAVGVPIQLLSNRPDVKQAEYALMQSYYSTNEARAAFYPSITLGGSAGWVNSAGSYIANPGKLLLSALGSLTQPIFSKGMNQARLKIAKAQQEEAAISFQQSLLNAGAEVNNALTQWQIARQRIDLDAKRIESLKSAEKSTHLLMLHGSTTYLEVLTAQYALLQAQLVEATDSFDQIQGVINLYHALGGGTR